MPMAVVATAFGGPEVLDLVDVEIPDPGPGEAVVEVRAAALNPSDWKRFGGLWGRDPGQLPMRVGSEASGVVLAVGPDALGATGPVAPGEEVIVYRGAGCQAQRVLVPASALTAKPPTLSFEAAAGLMLTGATAVHLLSVTDVGAGDVVLVHGASGGVGQAAVQLAAARGALVVGTASPRHHDLLRQLGAIPVAYGPGLAERVRRVAPGPVDAALDAVGTDEAVDTSLELVAQRGRIATIAAFGRADTGIRLLGGGPGADPGTLVREAARPELAGLAGSGALRVTVARTYPLAGAADAYRDAMAGTHGAGKVVLLP